MSKFDKYPTYKCIKKFAKEVYEDLNGIINPVLHSTKLVIEDEDIFELGTDNDTSFIAGRSNGYMWITFIMIDPNSILMMINNIHQRDKSITNKELHSIMRSCVIRTVVHELMHLNQDICFGKESTKNEDEENESGKSTETGNEMMARLWCSTHRNELHSMYPNLDDYALTANTMPDSSTYNYKICEFRTLKNVRDRFIEFLGMLSGCKILDFIYEYPKYDIYIRINKNLISDNRIYGNDLVCFLVNVKLFIGNTDLCKENSSTRLMNNIINILYSGHKRWGTISFIDPQCKHLVIEIQYLSKTTDYTNIALFKACDVMPEEMFDDLEEVPKHLMYIEG